MYTVSTYHSFPSVLPVLKPFLSGGDFKEDQHPVTLNISSWAYVWAVDLIFLENICEPKDFHIVVVLSVSFQEADSTKYIASG